MKIFVVLALACLLFASIFAAPEDATPGVLDITSANKESVFDGSKNVLVEFYAPCFNILQGCGHCKNLAPEYAKLGEMVEKSKPKDLIVAKVNCDAESAVCQNAGVRGYPTLKFFAKGQTTPEDYQGGRTAEDLADFINKKVGQVIRIQKAFSHVVELDASNFDSIVMDTSKDVLVEFYAKWCGHCKNLAPIYDKLAAAYQNEKNVVIAKIDADQFRTVGERFGVTGFPTLKFFSKNQKDTPMDYNKGRSLEDFVEFINEQCGTQRSAAGTLSEKAGRSDALDALAKEFMSNKEKRSEILEKVKQEVNGDLYVKAMQRIQEKGDDYAEKEKARLQKIMDSGSVDATRMDDMKLRQNVLSAF